MTSTYYDSLTAQSSVACFVYNLDAAQISFANDAFWHLLQLNKTSNLEDILNSIHPDDQAYVNEQLKLLLNGELSEHLKFRVKTTDTKERWICVAAGVFEQENHRFISGHIMDISPDVISQITYEKYANKKNSILNLLAHELSGLLSIAKFLGSSIKSENLDEYSQKQLANMYQINTQALELIRSLTAREFLETTEIVLSKKRVNFVQKLWEYIEEVKNAETNIERQITFNTNSPKVYVYLDVPKFMQVLNNLMSNALKFTYDNGNIVISLEERDEEVLLTFADDGIGIPAAFRDNLFDEYTPAGRRGLQGEPSMGLGMNVIKNIIEWHGGTIGFQSKENEGTTFMISIPKDTSNLSYQ